MKLLQLKNGLSWKWAIENVNFEEWQICNGGTGIAVYFRMIDDIKQGLISEGFKENKDFAII